MTRYISSYHTTFIQLRKFCKRGEKAIDFFLISSSIEIANRNRCDVLTAEVLFCELDRDNYIYVCNKLAILLLGEKRELGKYMVVISADMRSHARCSIGWS